MNNIFKRVSFLVVFLLTVSGVYVYFSHSRHPDKGTIIILNGPSASGKSTLQQAIQKNMDKLFLAVGIDNFFDVPMPQDFVEGQSYHHGVFIRGVKHEIDDGGHPIIKLINGEPAQKVICGMHRALAAYADEGNNLVVDYILYESNWLPDLIRSLKGYKVYFVGITTPLEIIEQREVARATSPIGHARSHFDIVHNHEVYDIEIDTSQGDPNKAALKIKQFIESTPNPQAFNKLQRKFGI